MTAAARPGAQGAGFTLLEVLLALALAAIVMVAATRLLVGSGHVDASVPAASGAMLALDLGADLLGGELRRAGYVPSPAPTGVSLDPRVPSLTLTIAEGARGDGLAVRFLDDRLAAGPVLRDLRFEAGVDGRGEPQLYRSTATGNRQPLVQGIAALRLTGWVDAAGWHGRAALASGPLAPWLVRIELTTGDGASRTVAVPLPSRPAAEVVRAP